MTVRGFRPVRLSKIVRCSCGASNMSGTVVRTYTSPGKVHPLPRTRLLRNPGRMTEQLPQRKNCYCRPEDSYCGTCQVCGEPGHCRHFPGPLPYTGAWCEAHYAVLNDRMQAAEDAAKPYGLRDDDRVYFRVPGRRRLFLWRTDSDMMEFRSQWLPRYVAVAPTSRVKWRLERWDHPISMWLLPLELMRMPDWQAVTADEFERVWAIEGSNEG